MQPRVTVHTLFASFAQRDLRSSAPLLLTRVATLVKRKGGKSEGIPKPS